jgi:hypothetical protein
MTPKKIWSRLSRYLARFYRQCAPTEFRLQERSRERQHDTPPQDPAYPKPNWPGMGFRP